MYIYFFYIYLNLQYIDNICEIIVSISRVGLGNMVMMGCVSPGLQPQTRQIWNTQKRVIWFHQKRCGNVTSRFFFAAQDDTFSFRCLWCCRISSPCAYLLWKVCLATMVWRAWEPCRRVRNGHKSWTACGFVSGKWIGMGNHRKAFCWLSCR